MIVFHAECLLTHHFINIALANKKSGLSASLRNKTCGYKSSDVITIDFNITPVFIRVGKSFVFLRLSRNRFLMIDETDVFKSKSRERVLIPFAP